MAPVNVSFTDVAKFMRDGFVVQFPITIQYHEPTLWARELLLVLPSQAILVSFNECRRHDRIDIVDLGNNTSGLHLLLSLVTMN